MSLRRLARITIASALFCAFPFTAAIAQPSETPACVTAGQAV
jgi:hypothetical protein